jgi:hypothetical protein
VAGGIGYRDNAGVSLVPGVSRAAAALFGGRLMGLSRQEAAEFSFLLAVPTLGAAAAYKFLKSPIVWTGERTAILLAGMTVAFLVALAAMRFLIAVWMRWGMRPFGWYRIALGARGMAGVGLGEILLIDKPYGWTSTRAVEWVKRRFRCRKAGHAGTLDPFATGLLIIGTESANESPFPADDSTEGVLCADSARLSDGVG